MRSRAWSALWNGLLTPEVRGTPAEKPRNVTTAFYVGHMPSSRQLESQSNCLLCEKDLQHCHGTAIVDDHGVHACSDNSDCTLDISEHWFVAFDEENSELSQDEGVPRAS